MPYSSQTSGPKRSVGRPAYEVTTSALLADTIQTLTDRARKKLETRRFLHVLGVAHTAMTLADLHRLGVERAAVAGLLHDLSKPLEPKAIESDLAKWDVAIPEEDRPHPRVWHGLHAAVWAERKLNLTDAEILEAVTLHTTADAAIAPLGMALFIADFVEPQRRIAQGPEILGVARRDLLEGFKTALRIKVGHVLSKGGTVHPRARRALRHYLHDDGAEELLATGS